MHAVFTFWLLVERGPAGTAPLGLAARRVKGDVSPQQALFGVWGGSALRISSLVIQVEGRGHAP